MTVKAPSLPYGDGASKIYGMENFGNTCYCNSILQCLYYTDSFRTHLVQHNNHPHSRRLAVPGVKPHGFTTKYEQLVQKKLKEAKSANGAARDVRPATHGSVALAASSNGSADGAAAGAAGASAAHNGTAGAFSTSGIATPPSSASAASQPPPLSKRGSIFGIKFNYSSNSNAAPAVATASAAASVAELRGSILVALDCEELSAEQQILIRKHRDFQELQLLVTRPPTAAQKADKVDYSQPLSMLLKDGDAASGSAPSGANAGEKAIVVVGIPYPDILLPYNPNPTLDQRKRAALVNGPIINLDLLLQLPLQVLLQLTLLYALRDLFEAKIENALQIGVVSPTWFITRLKEKNYLFRQNNMHHDAHEFCNYLINDIIECIDVEGGGPGGANWCNDIFKGLITNETKCLSCETITSKEESFLDLSVDIPPGEAAYLLTHSLNNFSKMERLTHQNKFYCNTCLSLQEATKTIKVKLVPEVLVVNLKRFKYDEKLERMVKLFDSILYLHKLRLFNTKAEKERGSDSDDFTLFELYALVVHIGGGPMHGHYVALCKTAAKLWLLFDDENVELVDDSYVMRFFGDGPGLASAYILFYRKCDTEPRGEEGGCDFGFSVDEMYNGGDYALAAARGSASGALLVSETERLSAVSSGGVESLSGSGATLAPDIAPPEPSEEPKTETAPPLARRATGLFKKTPKVDDEGALPSTSPNGETRTEKKSWVGGLKRRETKLEKAENQSVTSVSSGGSDSKRKSIFGFKRRSKD